MSEASRLGIIAGNGVAPRRVIEACRAQRRDFFVVCLEGQCAEETARDVPHVWLPLGALGLLKKCFAEQKIGQAVMIGGVRRPSLSEIKPDWAAVKALAKIGFNALGDDALLRAIGKVIEEETGVPLIGAHDILGGNVMKEGPLGQVAPDAEALRDIARGVDILALLGKADIGQSVVVQQGLVLGVEAIEGTDALIARCGALQREGARGILVKMAKPQQDDRFDMPTIGPDSVLAAAKAGLGGIAFTADRGLVINRDQVVALADAHGLFVFGV